MTDDHQRETGYSDARPRGENDETDYIGSRDLASWPSRWGGRLADVVVTWAVGFHRWMGNRSIPYVVLLVTALVGMVLTGLLTYASAQIYDNVSDRDGLAGFDRSVLEQMIGWRSPDLNETVTRFTELGGAAILPFLALAAATGLSLWWQRFTPVLLMAIAAGGSLAMTFVGKQAMGRARPGESFAVPPFESSASFPSGHTLNSWVISLLVAYLVCCQVRMPWVRVATVALAVLFGLAMGASRVFLGHHWLTDVLVGWTLGSAWLIAVVTGHRLAVTVRRHQRAGPDRG